MLFINFYSIFMEYTDDDFPLFVRTDSISDLIF